MEGNADTPSQTPTHVHAWQRGGGGQDTGHVTILTWGSRKAPIDLRPHTHALSLSQADHR